MRQFLAAFVAALAAFYVTLLAVQAVSNGQLTRRDYVILSSVTSVAAGIALVVQGIRCRTPMKTPAPKAGTVGRLLCESCGKPLRANRWRCPVCGATQPVWTVSPGMMSSRARRRAQAIVSVPGEDSDEDVFDGDEVGRQAIQEKAARYLIEQSGRLLETGTDPVEQVLANSGLAKSLYWSAAQRLHPDHNNGEHLAAWFELQQALAILSADALGETGSNGSSPAGETVRSSA